jgi:SNF2 family DNA or RNA helicase
MFAAVDAAWLLGELPMLKGAPWPPRVIHNGPGHSFTLFPFQCDGVAFLHNKDYAILADEMGLGKTVQALISAEYRLGIASRGIDVLILCPALAKRHWAREVAKWTHGTSAILDGLRPRELPCANYLIANYDILSGQRRRNASGKLEYKEGLEGWGKLIKANIPPIVILDEAHMLRGRDSRRTKAIKDIVQGATCVWALTGTPMPNHVRDLWSLVDIISNGLFGPYWPWAKAYAGAYKGQYGWIADGGSRLEELSQRLSYFMLQRSKAEVGIQLPEKRREVMTIETQLENVSGAGKIVSRTYTEKQNAVSSALRRTAQLKRPAVIEMAKECLDAGQKIVVGVYMREQAEEIGKALAQNYIGVAASGDASVEQRDSWAQAFREYEGPCFFVCTIDSMQLSISLVGADLMIIGDLTWDPTKLLQFEGRVHRIGSGKPVLIRYLIVEGTIDEDVQEAVIDKLDTIAQVVGESADTQSFTQQLGGKSNEAIIDRLFQRLING